MECYNEESFVSRLAPILPDEEEEEEEDADKSSSANKEAGCQRRDGRLLEDLLVALQPLTLLPFTLDLHLCIDASGLLKAAGESLFFFSGLFFSFLLFR